MVKRVLAAAAWLRKRFGRLSPMQMIVVSFAGVIALGTALLLLPACSRNRESCGLLTALFTATSATCVTGLSLTDTWTQWSGAGQAVILLMIQIGGLGFMTLISAVFLLAKGKIHLRQRLIVAQALSVQEIGGVVNLVRSVLRLTLTAEAIGAAILAARLIPDVGIARGIWWGIFHAVSAFCNAGFDLMGGIPGAGSLSVYRTDWVVMLTVMALIIFGGLGFLVWEDLRSKRSFRRLSLYSRLVLWITGGLLLGGTVLIWLCERHNPGTLGGLSRAEQLLLAAFQSVTCRTAGFWTVPQGSLTDGAKAISIFLMFIGGSSGSTAGGFKTVSFGVLLLWVWSAVRGKSHLTVWKQTIADSQITNAAALFVSMTALAFLGGVILTCVNPVGFLDGLYEAVSALATVGVTTGITPGLTVGSKLLLILYMFFGRVGLLTVSLGFLTGDRTAERYRYAEAPVLIG